MVNMHMDGATGKICCDDLYANDELILKYFCKQILAHFGQGDTANIVIKRRWRVAATAVLFFRRFYMYHSIRANDPRLLMVCCMFLAGKLEEHYANFVPLRDLLRMYGGYGEEEVMLGEIRLVEGLRFDLSVFHPHNCMNALVAEWKRACRAADEDGAKALSVMALDWLRDAQLVLRTLQVTVAALCYRPLSIAVCCLLATEPVADQQLHPPLVSLEQHLAAKLGAEEGIVEPVPVFSGLMHDVEELRRLVVWGAAKIDDGALCEHIRELRAANTWGPRRAVQTSRPEGDVGHSTAP